MNMGIFHRSLSSSSRTSTTLSESSENATPRTSIESADYDSSLEQTIKPQTAPILNLPVELLQHVASYLDTASSASLCLSSRYIYYALGTDSLTTYIDTAKSRFERRKKIEAVVERAFPGHWFCAWCDGFHAWDASTGPRNINDAVKRKTRDCADFNSFLPANSSYVLRYHHIRLALNRALRGPDHGISLDAFTHSSAGMAKLYRTPVPTKLDTSAKIVSGHLMLYTSFAIILPSWCISRKSLINTLWPLLPHLLSGHRDTDNGHTGLMAAIDNVVRRGWKYPFTQMCATCATDWTVHSHFFPHASGGQVRLVLQSWRDLGDGRNPFDSAWRAHGVSMRGLERSGGDLARVTGLQAGDVRRSYEMAEEGNGDGEVGLVGRSVSPVRERIYQAFVRRESGEVRRSRESARPRGWRTIEEMELREEREREEVVRGRR
jgi:hypothetical protein